MNIELYNDDCMNVLDNLGHTIDLGIFDLPYGQTKCDWDNTIDLTLLWTKLTNISKPTTCFIFFTTTRFGYELIKSNEKMFRYDLVWSKPNSKAGFLNSKKMPMRTHEMLYVFYKKLPTYNFSMYHTKIKSIMQKKKPSGVYGNINEGQWSVYEPRPPSSILEFNINKNIKIRNHPTEKPIELLKWIIKYYSNENDVVLDVTMGSGSTGVACKELNRYFIGIEMDKTYYDIACNRLLSTEQTNNDDISNLSV